MVCIRIRKELFTNLSREDFSQPNDFVWYGKCVCVFFFKDQQIPTKTRNIVIFIYLANSCIRIYMKGTRTSISFIYWYILFTQVCIWMLIVVNKTLPKAEFSLFLYIFLWSWYIRCNEMFVLSICVIKCIYCLLHWRQWCFCSWQWIILKFELCFIFEKSDCSNAKKHKNSEPLIR